MNQDTLTKSTSTAENYHKSDLLRFTTAGSVDDGKSTLIGRLLYDSKKIFEDQLEAIINTSNQRGNGHLDLSLLTDGLRAEREQGITIDVAYRYFATAKRKFIIADCPGHAQYTRNMITGASTANLIIILIWVYACIMFEWIYPKFFPYTADIKDVLAYAVGALMFKYYLNVTELLEEEV